MDIDVTHVHCMIALESTHWHGIPAIEVAEMPLTQLVGHRFDRIIQVKKRGIKKRQWKAEAC